MLSTFVLLLCVETDAVNIWFIVVGGGRWCQHRVYYCVWRQMLSAFGSLLCVETDAISIWFIVACGDRCDQHLVDSSCVETDAVSIWFIDVCMETDAVSHLVY